jgi:hypothetical protein
MVCISLVELNVNWRLSAVNFQLWSKGQTRTSLIFGIRIIIFEELDLELDLQFRSCVELELGLEDLHKMKEPCSTGKKPHKHQNFTKFQCLKKFARMQKFATKEY